MKMTDTTRHIGRRDFLAASGAALATAAFPVSAQGFPTRPITLVVPYPPGGPEVLLRLMGKSLGDYLNQPTIVENRPGASGMIGAAYVQKSKPDGYTILLSGNSSLVLYAMLRKPSPLDVTADLEPVSPILSYPMVLTVPAALGVNSVAELVALLRREPKRAVFSSPGAGSLGHMGGEVFANRTGLRLLHVPYKGNNDAQVAMMAGDVSLLMDAPPSANELIKSGRTRALAISSSRRLPGMPDVPTFTELGFDGMEIQVWLAAFAPKGTPLEIVKTLANGVTRALAVPEVRDAISQGGLATPLGGPPEALSSMISSDRAFWRDVIARNKLSLAE